MSGEFMGHMPCTSMLLTRITSSTVSRDGPGSVRGRAGGGRKGDRKEVKRKVRGRGSHACQRVMMLLFSLDWLNCNETLPALLRDSKRCCSAREE